MKFYSTRNELQAVNLSTAISLGLAHDGGLFLPQEFPRIDLTKLNQQASYAEFASAVLSEFFKQDQLSSRLVDICRNSFNFPVPLTKLDDKTQLLELYHGPTLSFKDFGAQFLAGCMNELAKINQDNKITILVATSGDTGSAVANAFYGKSNVNVVILFPKGQITKRQQQQISCYGGNVLAIAIEGNFDACQEMVKQSFADNWWQNVAHISSANSINLGRLLPQITYYAYTSYHSQLQTANAANFIIPSGNLGNATAAYCAKKMGFPIDKIVLASNANCVVSDFLATGKYTPRPSLSTLANAMDVGNPSNFERLSSLYPDFNDFRANVSAYSVSDEQIIQTIKDTYAKCHTIICPHTATALYVRNHCLGVNDTDKEWIVVATAHPSKFEMVIEPILQLSIQVPQELEKMLSRNGYSLTAAANLAAVSAIVKQNFYA